MTEPSSRHPQVAEWLAHIRALAVDIGPRGPTRLGERQGSEYARPALKKWGYNPPGRPSPAPYPFSIPICWAAC